MEQVKLVLVGTCHGMCDAPHWSGVIHEAAAATARAAGLTVVMDRCMMAEHARLIGPAD